LHTPDGIRRTAAGVGQALRVPDCTGGSAPQAQVPGTPA
jgi:hypothetical protein